MIATAQETRQRGLFVPSPRPPRQQTVAPWSLARQGQPWSDQDRTNLTSWWRDPTWDTLDIAAALKRAEASVRQQACRMNLGARPRDNEEQPVALRPTHDGVVLTARLTEAYARVARGAEAATVAADLRLTAIEAAALRRWSAAP